MSVQENKALLTSMFKELGGVKKPPAKLDEYISDEVLKEHVAIIETAFPCYELRLEDMIAEGDRVAVRATMIGRHQGELSGIPATGREVNMALMIIYRIAEGKIAEHWIISDQMGLMQQLGVVAETEPAPG